MKKRDVRIVAFTSAVIFIFVLLASRLFYIQIVNGDEMRSIAEDKGEKPIVELAPRGDILDRNGKKIATSTQTFNIVISNLDSKIKNDEINPVLLETIRIINKNNDGKKINTQSLPIALENNQFVFYFKIKSERIKKIWEKSFKERNKLEESFTAKDSFYYLAEKYELLSKDSSGKKTLKYNMNIDEALKVIALRLSIKEQAYSQYKTIYIAKNVNRKTAFAVQSKILELPGIQCEVAPMRVYPYGNVGSAFIGHLGRISDEESQTYNSLGYDINRELIGKLGLEKVLENNKELNISLRGEPGVRYVRVNKFGKVIGENATLDPIPGDTVITTINMDVQLAAEKAMAETLAKIRSGEIGGKALKNANAGAAIAIDVNTGEVIAMVSYPGFDPNIFAETGSISPEMSNIIYPDISQDKANLIPLPTLNYATMGQGPPGSTFKPLTAIAGLEEGVITPSTIIYDYGIYRGVNGFNGACWVWNERHTTHGPTDVAKALQVSCNYFFFEVGKRLGSDKFQKWAVKFGLAKDPVTGESPKSGIEIEERAGSASTSTKYKRTRINSVMRERILNVIIGNVKYGGYTFTEGSEEYIAIKNMMLEGRFDKQKLNELNITNERAQKKIEMEINRFNSEAKSIGEVLNASIGQGATELTPLQLANYIATLVNGGNRYKVHLIKQVLNPDGTVKKDIQPEILDKLSLKEQNVKAVIEGMAKVTSEGGTAAWVFRNYEISTGGKTGSAEVSKFQEAYGRSAYGWYVGFAPLDKPQIAVAVVGYNAGHGNSVAPVAKAIYDAYFKVGAYKEQKVQENTLNQQSQANNNQNNNR